jgi:6-phosphogluconolactonase
MAGIATLNAQRHGSAEALADALATRVAELLREAVVRRGHASLVVSGGSTPVPFFHRLSEQELPWAAVTVTVADERWVPEHDERSNARLVREHLLRGAAAQARFVSLKTDAADPFAGESATAQRLGQVPRPFDVVVLGMGGDGHTASLFPNSEQLAFALDPDTARPCLGVHGDKPPRERISLTAAALLDSRWIALHIGGEEKWEVLTAAAEPGDAAVYPIRAILHQQKVPVHVYWSP